MSNAVRRTSLLFVAVLAIAGCDRSKESGNNNLGTGDPDASLLGTCMACEFVGQTGMCIGEDEDIVADAKTDNPDLLQTLENSKSVCPGEEVCMFCNDPITGEETGACDLAPLLCPDSQPESTCAEPLSSLNVDRLTPCGPAAHCVDTRNIDVELLDELEPCDDEGLSMCMPDVIINTDGHYFLDECAGTIGNPGRCLPIELNEVAVAIEEDGLEQGDCAEGFVCSTCFSPVDGEPTGACAQSCEEEIPPILPEPQLYPDCYQNRGRCLASNTLSQGTLDVTEQFDCQNGFRCVPDQSVNDGPYVLCTGDIAVIGEYTGTCLDMELIDAGSNERRFDNHAACEQAFGLENMGCVPCRDRDQVPTNASGCPDNPPLNERD